MQKNTKWLFASLAGILCALIVAIAPVGGKAYAAGISETEPNDTNVTANVIAVNTEYAGTLSNGSDVDWFKFTTDKQGYFTVTFAAGDLANASEIGWGWDMYVYKEDAQSYLHGKEGIKDSFTTMRIPFEPGTFYIKVKAAWGNSAPKGQPYKLIVNFTEASDWEIEDNGVNTKANTIAVGSTLTANSYYDKDTDWYKFTTDKRGYFNVKFAVSDTADTSKLGWGWDVNVYASDMQTVLDGKGRVTGSYMTMNLPFEAGTYYIKINTSWSNSAPVGQDYKVSVLFTETADWEIEGNNLKANATIIPTDAAVSGIFHNAEDEDWYKFTVTDAGTQQICLNFGDSVVADSLGWGYDIFFYDSNLEAIRSWGRIAKDSFKTEILDFEKGTYYIKIKAAWANSAPVACEYKLKVATTKSSVWEVERNDVKTSATKLNLNKTFTGTTLNDEDTDWYKVAVTKTGKLNLKFAAHEDNNFDNVGWGWNVYIYKSNDLTTPLYKVEKIQNAKAVDIPVDVKKGTYYVRVVPAWSNSAPTTLLYTLRADFAATPAATSITKATPGSKSVKLTWKKSKNATGYYVYRSTSKNGKYTKVATIKKNSTVTYTDKKSVKKGKTYYYKVVAYTKVGSATAESKASAVKSAKAN